MGLRRKSALTAVKTLHSALWAFFAACIPILPVAAAERRFRLAALLSALVWIECGVLAANRGRCPLTAVAARFTSGRSPAFDIYLPAWLARHNVRIFGALFVLGELVALVQWLRFRLGPIH